MDLRRFHQVIWSALAILAVAGCGPSEVSPSQAGPDGATQGTAGPTASTPAPRPPERPCVQPKSTEDVRVGAKVIVEATVARGAATTHSAAGSVIPLQDVKVLWSLAPSQVAPTALSAANVGVSDADLLLGAGRYVLLLGSSTPGVYYLAQGREGAFALVDETGSSLTRLCTVYTSDGRAQPAARAPGSIDRQTLLELSISAATSDPANPTHS